MSEEIDGLREEIQKEIKERMFDYSDKARFWTRFGNWINTLILVSSSTSSAAGALMYFGITEKETALIGSLLAALVAILTGVFNKLKFTDNANAARQISVGLDKLHIKSRNPEVSIADILKEYEEVIGQYLIKDKKPD